MLTQILNFFDKHLGTLAGTDLFLFLGAGVLVYAIYKGAPILQEFLKNKKQVVERRKGMNGDLEKTIKEYLDKVLEKEREGFEEYKDFADKRHNEDRKQNAAEHKDLNVKMEAVRKDVGEIKIMVVRLDERSKKES